MGIKGRSDTVKAILVIEMPENCDKCRIRCEHYYSAYKNGTTKSIKPDSCPLKPMPEKKEPDKQSIKKHFEAIGYNTCIDEILGDKE